MPTKIRIGKRWYCVGNVLTHKTCLAHNLHPEKEVRACELMTLPETISWIAEYLFKNEHPHTLVKQPEQLGIYDSIILGMYPSRGVVRLLIRTDEEHFASVTLYIA